MKYAFEFTKRAEKDFQKFNKAFQKRIISKLEFFENQADPLEFSKKLTGTKNKYRFRLGEYRILVAKKPNNKLVILLILRIAHRREVYN